MSHVEDADDVARASATCRKWRDAATQHLNKLAFSFFEWTMTDSDTESEEERRDGYDSEEERRIWEDREVIITEAIMRRTCLRELSIRGVRRIHAAPLIAWLLHTKHTLKSFTFLPDFATPVNVLEKLGGALESLKWGCAYMPVLNPVIHNLPSLVSLTIYRVNEGLRTGKDLQILLSLFPKLESLTLESLTLEWMKIEDAPSTVHLNIPPPLKTLIIQRLYTEEEFSIVLHADSLKSLSVVGWSKIFLEIEQVESLKYLVIREARVSRLCLLHNLQHLEIRGRTDFGHVEIGDLISLHTLCLAALLDFTKSWPIFSRIISNASTKLSKLQVIGGHGFRSGSVVDVDMLVSLFPCLHMLSLDYIHAFFQEPSLKPTILEQLLDLELYTCGEAVDHNQFGQWVVKFLERCPNLKRLAISMPDEEDEAYQVWGQVTSFVRGLMREYPHVEVIFDLEEFY